ncbi:uncharacterized protein LOC122466175 [Chelonia mydas]|uniref:uncharacterized protein LOC122466175 n=1 Tax=Chelonia mydas TaxID=8469 RepID=UPI001CA8285A|nr:uncharacterized protein LOC122466175 [Chelonia mydas]
MHSADGVPGPKTLNAEDTSRRQQHLPKLLGTSCLKDLFPGPASKFKEWELEATGRKQGWIIISWIALRAVREPEDCSTYAVKHNRQEQSWSRVQRQHISRALQPLLAGVPRQLAPTPAEAWISLPPWPGPRGSMSMTNLWLTFGTEPTCRCNTTERRIPMWQVEWYCQAAEELEDRIAVWEQILALQFLGKQCQLREKTAQQKDVFERLIR